MSLNIILAVFVLLFGVILVLEMDSNDKLRKLYKLAKLRNSPIPDAKYFELKSSISLIRILLSGALLFMGFLGFNSYYELKNSMINTINKEVIVKFDKYKEVLDESYIRFDNYDTLFDRYLSNLGEMMLLSDKYSSLIDTTITSYDVILDKRIERFNSIIIQAEKELEKLKKLNERNK